MRSPSKHRVGHIADNPDTTLVSVQCQEFTQKLARDATRESAQGTGDSQKQKKGQEPKLLPLRSLRSHQLGMFGIPYVDVRCFRHVSL